MGWIYCCSTGTKQMRFEGKYFIPYLYLDGFYLILLSGFYSCGNKHIFNISYLFLSERKKCIWGNVFLIIIGVSKMYQYLITGSSIDVSFCTDLTPWD